MVASFEPCDSLQVGVARFWSKDVRTVTCLMLAQFLQRIKGVRKRTGGDQQNLTIQLCNGIAESTSQSEVVFGLRGLAATDTDPLLIQTFAEVLPQINGCVKDWKFRVINRSNPGAMFFSIFTDLYGQLWIAFKVIRYLCHTSG